MAKDPPCFSQANLEMTPYPGNNYCPGRPENGNDAFQNQAGKHGFLTGKFALAGRMAYDFSWIVRWLPDGCRNTLPSSNPMTIARPGSTNE